jgi:hypothetical protein
MVNGFLLVTENTYKTFLSISLSEIIFYKNYPRRRYHRKILNFKGAFIFQISLLRLGIFLSIRAA